MSVANFSCISSKLFLDIFKLCLCQNSIASLRNYSKTFSNDFFAKLQKHLIKIILRNFQSMSVPNLSSISSKLFYDIFKICLCQNAIASQCNYSKISPNNVSAKISHSLLTQCILLSLESKQCPLLLTSVLSCADSADELQFWSKSES